MTRIVLGLFLAIAVPGLVSAQSIEGMWKLSYITFGTTEQMPAIVKIVKDGGVVQGELVASSPRIKELELKSVTQEGDTLRIVLKTPATEMVFEAIVVKGAKALKGSMTAEPSVFPALLYMTNEKELDLKSSVRALDCPPAQEARKLVTRGPTLRQKKLLKEAAEADAIAKKETPKLYREVLEKYSDSPAVFDSALNLIKSAEKSDAKIDEVKSWAATAMKTAKAFGPRMNGEIAAQIADSLLRQEEYAKLAADYARDAEKSLGKNATPADQVRILSIVSRALRASKLEAEAKAIDVRVAKLDEILDREYSAKMPGFKGTKFEGRKGKSDRAVFMELFTGATCPPCVAADLAFDVLQKTYKTSELVLVQYHVHIPGPDPMTNPDTVARWNHYGKAFPGQVRGVPSSLFNGKPQGGGGGGVANAENKYFAYREIIDPLLEEDAGAKLSAQAIRKGDRIEISVDVNGLANPGADKKLRILLAEETVRYAGSNKIRLHHNVVRAMPGGVEGKALMEKASKHTASIVLPELRSSLNKYLDDYQATVRPFLNPARPLEFANLRVIAFVQDDTSHEILQAVQVEVK